MLELLTDSQAWASLVDLTALEIVLGIDNLMFLSIVVRPPARLSRPSPADGSGLGAPRPGALLFSLTWMIGLTQPVVTIADVPVSWRDVVLLVGGAVPDRQGDDGSTSCWRGTRRHHRSPPIDLPVAVSRFMVLDVVFGARFIITAVGIDRPSADDGAAVVIAMIVMLLAADPVGNFVNAHRRQDAALSFLLLAAWR